MTHILGWPALRTAAAIFLLVFFSLWLVPVPLSQLFSDRFLPHATCYLRNPQLIWLHATSDGVIGLSYVAISSTLAYLVYKARREIPFHWMFLAFGLFIITCGFTHFMEVWTVWQPVYWFAGYVKIVTAIASLSTALLLPPLVPKITAMIRAARMSEERKLALETVNAELSEANEELKAFTFSASHDLRSPLSSIIGMSHLLRESLPDNVSPTTIEYSDRISTAAARMNQMLDDLLSYSLSLKTTDLLVAVPLEEVVREVLQEAESEIQRSRGSVQISGALPTVLGNRTFLKLIVANLIGNAIKYVPKERAPVVDISAVTEGGSAELSVSDNGIGIAPAYQKKVFEPFERLHTQRELPGTGLGLAIVARAARKMNGEAGVESAVGKGSRFWIRLPVAS